MVPSRLVGRSGFDQWNICGSLKIIFKRDGLLCQQNRFTDSHHFDLPVGGEGFILGWKAVIQPDERDPASANASPTVRAEDWICNVFPSTLTANVRAVVISIFIPSLTSVFRLGTILSPACNQKDAFCSASPTVNAEDCIFCSPER